MRRKRAGSLVLLLLVLVSVVAGCATAPAWRRTERTYLPGVAERALNEIDAALLRLGAAPAEVRRDERQERATLDQPVPVAWSRWAFTLVAFPTFRKLTPEDYAGAVREGARLAGAEAVAPGARKQGEALRLVVRVPVTAGGRRFKVDALEIVIRAPGRESVATAPPAVRPTPPPASAPVDGAPRVALIIDDWGYQQSLATDFFSLPVPLTMAVIPFLPASGRLAKAGQAHGWEVILHLPMEAEKHQFESTEGLIRVDMSDAEIRAAVNRALDAVPQADGVNNHLGSLATQDPRVMGIVLERLSARNLFFVDSRTSAASVAARLARERGMRFGENALFLDNQNGVEYVRTQLQSLVNAAKVYGYALGIGHVRRETLSALQLELPGLIAAGVRFVPARDVVATDFRRPVRFGAARRPSPAPAPPTEPGDLVASPPPAAAPAAPPAPAPKAHPPAAPAVAPAVSAPPSPAPVSAPAVSEPAPAPAPVPASAEPSLAEVPAPEQPTTASGETPAPAPSAAESNLPQSAGPSAPTQEL